MARDLDDAAFHLAALVHSVGRAGAARALADGTPPDEAYRRLARPLEDPRRLARLCTERRIRLLTPDDLCYPALLRDIPDPPPVLYAVGQTDALLRPTVAIVGARRCTRVGAEVASRLAAGLAEAGVAVVSGLALGIDTAVHRGALAAGITVAMIGSGLVNPYPLANRGLCHAIVDRGGLLLSEYPPLAGARRHHFPERNRLISGTALGVVVVEAGEHSGSLITARMALEQGREVFAVPGSVVSPVSRGCHRLLREGAGLVESVQDVLEGLGLPAPGHAPPAGALPNRELARILATVDGAVTTLDEIIGATGVPGASASAALVELELAGFVRQVPGGYIRRPPA